jgi:hypothetical protein
MAHDTDLQILLAELRSVGLRPQVEKTGGNHNRVTWCVEGKEERVYFCSSTPSDYRSRLNVRADVRRMLRADNVALEKTASRPQLQRAMEVPRAAPSIPEELTALRNEVADLAALVGELAEDVKFVRSRLTPRIVEAAVEPALPSGRRHALQPEKLLRHLTVSPQSVTELRLAVGASSYKTVWRALNELAFNREPPLAAKVGTEWRITMAGIEKERQRNGDAVPGAAGPVVEQHE